MSGMTEKNKLRVGMSGMTEKNRLRLGMSGMRERNKLRVGLVCGMTESNTSSEWE